MADIFTGLRLNRFYDEDSTYKKVIKKTSSENIFDFEYEFEKISDDINQKFISKKNDLIISLLNPGSVTKLEKEGFIIPMQFAVIRLYDGYDSNFIIGLLKSELFDKELNKLVEGSGLKIIKANYLKEISLPVPDYEKQEKIGELLNLIEKKIVYNNQINELERKAQKAIINEVIGGK